MVEVTALLAGTPAAGVPVGSETGQAEWLKTSHHVGFALWADVAGLPRYVRPVPEAEMRRHSRIVRVSHKMERRSARNRRRWFSANASRSEGRRVGKGCEC